MSSALRHLPVEERIRLVEDLWDSIAADQQALPLSEAQRAELDARLDRYEQDGDAGRSAQAVMDELRKNL
jgi:putative addiction module component (TIGR02574 family)